MLCQDPEEDQEVEALAAAEAAAEVDSAAVEAAAEASEADRAPAASAEVHIIDPREAHIGAFDSDLGITIIIITAPIITAADALADCSAF